MDDADRARRYQDQMLERARAVRRTEHRLPAVGACHNCEAPVTGPRRFCDAACADEWEQDQQRRRVQ
jgi:hypothetical protein